MASDAKDVEVEMDAIDELFETKRNMPDSSEPVDPGLVPMPAGLEPVETGLAVTQLVHVEDVLGHALDLVDQAREVNETLTDAMQTVDHWYTPLIEYVVKSTIEHVVKPTIEHVCEHVSDPSNVLDLLSKL